MRKNLCILFLSIYFLLVNIALSQSVKVTTPNGGEKLEPGSAYSIKWSSSPARLPVIIQYTTNANDANPTWKPATPDAQTSGSYIWMVPSEPTSNAKVKVSYDPSIYDISDNNFTIVGVKVTAPNGGDKWRAGSTQYIKWNSGGVGSINIEYTEDANATSPTWRLIASNQINTGIYSWKVPNTLTTTAKIRISSLTPFGSIKTDISDNNFSIVDIKVITPNGAEENWLTGSTNDIIWTSTGISDVKIEYTTDNGSNWTTITEKITNTKKYSWRVPNIPTTNAKIRVSDASNSSISDASDAVFTMKGIKITSPNGGEIWPAGSVQNITWASAGASQYVEIYYTADDGTTWTKITTATLNTGSYTWTVPYNISTTTKVKVVDSSNASLSDMSDANFIIQGIIVTSPNGGETWLVGSTQNITWAFTGSIPYVVISYSTDGGSSWFAIAKSITNTGSYSWNIPDTPTSNAMVRVYSSSNSSIGDVSNYSFVIYRSEIIIEPWKTSGRLTEIPNEFALNQNYPNPFNPNTMINFDLPEDDHVILNIYNINGQLVRTLMNGARTAGSHSITWDATNEAG
jgi:hypothetical protein